MQGFWGIRAPIQLRTVGNSSRRYDVGPSGLISAAVIPGNGATFNSAISRQPFSRRRVSFGDKFGDVLDTKEGNKSFEFRSGPNDD